MPGERVGKGGLRGTEKRESLKAHLPEGARKPPSGSSDLGWIFFPRGPGAGKGGSRRAKEYSSVFRSWRGGERRQLPHRPSRPAWPGTFCRYLMLHSSGYRDIHRVDADSHSHPGAPKFSVHENVCVCGHWLLAFLSLHPPDQCTTSQPGTQKFSQTFLLPNPTHRRLQTLRIDMPDTLMPGEVGKRLLLSRHPSHLPNCTMMLSALGGEGCLMPCNETLWDAHT